MKCGPRSMNFGLEILWQLFKASSPIPCSRKRWYMDLSRDFVVKGDVCTLRCTAVTGGGELRQVIFVFLVFGCFYVFCYLFIYFHYVICMSGHSYHGLELIRIPCQKGQPLFPFS